MNQYDYNPDLFRFIPATAQRVMEVGCGDGALARALKAERPSVHYVGCDIDASAIDKARAHCDEALLLDIETAEESFFKRHQDRDCWIFGDSLEHLRDPWTLLKKIRAGMPSSAAVVACIPNAQHWSVQKRLCVGELYYAKSGLLDRTHLRWFTRKTIIKMFHDAGFGIQAARARIFDEPERSAVMPSIKAMAQAAGADPYIAEQDATAYQYVIVATPIVQTTG